MDASALYGHQQPQDLQLDDENALSSLFLFGNHSESYSEAEEEELFEELDDSGHAEAGIVVYSCFFAVSVVANGAVIASLVRARKLRRNRINLLMLHLAVADLCVALVTMPTEIGWRATNAWRGGEVGCRLLGGLMRAFPLYLSSLVVVAISFDRYFALKYPLRRAQAERQAKLMLVGAWAFAFLAALPQVSH
jgi:gonadotropin-releasing hormone receptor